MAYMKHYLFFFQMNTIEKVEYIMTYHKKDLWGLRVYLGKFAIYFDIQELSERNVDYLCVSPRIKKKGKKEKNISYLVLN